jgi:hypothetical protein
MPLLSSVLDAHPTAAHVWTRSWAWTIRRTHPLWKPWPYLCGMETHRCRTFRFKRPRSKILLSWRLTSPHTLRHRHAQRLTSPSKAWTRLVASVLAPTTVCVATSHSALALVGLLSPKLRAPPQCPVYQLQLKELPVAARLV